MSESLVFALIVGAGLAWWLVVNRKRPVRFRPRQVLTGPGLEFLFRLNRALPECIVCPQMAATALLEPLGMGSIRKSALSRIVGRRVGYAIFDEQMKLIAVIELDHRPRLTRREAECEGYFADAGIKTLRFHPRRMPSEAKIRASVFPRTPGEASGKQPERIGNRDDAIEFKPRGRPWRNTVNAHI